MGRKNVVFRCLVHALALSRWLQRMASSQHPMEKAPEVSTQAYVQQTQQQSTVPVCLCNPPPKNKTWLTLAANVQEISKIKRAAAPCFGLMWDYCLQLSIQPEFQMLFIFCVGLCSLWCYMFLHWNATRRKTWKKHGSKISCWMLKSLLLTNGRWQSSSEIYTGSHTCLLQCCKENF